MTRAALYTALRDEAERRGVTVEYGKRLVDVTGRVRAVFADGSTADGDLVIGADGLRSRTRELIDPHAPKMRYLPLLNTGGYAKGVTAGQAGTFHMVFGRHAFFGYFPRTGDEVWWFANPPQRKELSAAQLAAITPEQWRARLLELFAKDDSPAVDLIRHSAWIAPPWNTYDMPRVPKWHNDTMVLIGDAAHVASPTSGQGASLAVEDALVLAKCLRDLPDPPAAFAAFERLRRARVERVVAQAKQRGGTKIVGPVGRLVRDHVVFPLLKRRVATASGEEDRWLHDYRVDWTAPVT